MRRWGPTESSPPCSSPSPPWTTRRGRGRHSRAQQGQAAPWRRRATAAVLESLLGARTEVADNTLRRRTDRAPDGSGGIPMSTRRGHPPGPRGGAKVLTGARPDQEFVEPFAARRSGGGRGHPTSRRVRPRGARPLLPAMDTSRPTLRRSCPPRRRGSLRVIDLECRSWRRPASPTSTGVHRDFKPQT